MAKQCSKCQYADNTQGFICLAANDEKIAQYTWDITELTEEEIAEVIYNNDLECPVSE